MLHDRFFGASDVQSMNGIRNPLQNISANDVMSSPAPTANRRKSGRAVKAPEKFVPDAPSSQVGSTSTKRKRSGEALGDDASDIEEEEDDSEQESESAGEEVIRKPTRKKTQSKSTRRPALKKPKTNGKAANDDDEDEDEDAAPTHSIRLPARPKKARKNAIQDEGVEGLYGKLCETHVNAYFDGCIGDVFASDKTLKDVVGEWLVRHGENEPLAVTELVNFTLRSAGCEIELTEDHINDTDAADGTVADLQAQYQAVSWDCSVVSSTILTIHSKTSQTILSSRRRKEAMISASRSWNFGHI